MIWPKRPTGIAANRVIAPRGRVEVSFNNRTGRIEMGVRNLRHGWLINDGAAFHVRYLSRPDCRALTLLRNPPYRSIPPAGPLRAARNCNTEERGARVKSATRRTCEGSLVL